MLSLCKSLEPQYILILCIYLFFIRYIRAARLLPFQFLNVDIVFPCNSKTPEAFADYARLCYRELGAYVKIWITLNEPNDEMVSYPEGHEMLRAHALAWHAYDREFRYAQGGKVSEVLVLCGSGADLEKLS